jgi:predicted permease
MNWSRKILFQLRARFALDTLAQDVRFGVRILKRNPAVAVIAVASLALGLTLNSAVFSLVDGLWLRARPFADPSRVVRLFGGTPRYKHGDLSFMDCLDLRAQMQSVTDLAFNERRGALLDSEEGPELLRADTVSRNFFSVLGVKPYLGRFFSETDAPDLKNTPAVVLSHRLWLRRFRADTRLIGQPVVLSGRSEIVLGIAPPNFNGLERLNPAEVWYPFETRTVGTSRNDRWLDAVGRLKTGCTVEQARAEAEAIFRRLELKDAASGAPLRAVVRTEASYQFEQTGTLGLLLLGIVGTVLLLACANVSSLLLARAEARAREMAMRSALGGSRWRLVRQLLAESLVLALIAGAASLLLGKWLTSAWPSLLPAEMVGPVGLVVHFDGRVVGFTAALSCLTLFLFGLVPALYASKVDLLSTLKQDVAPGVPGRKHAGLNVLVVGQMCVALVLVSMAALLTRSLWACYAADLGFEKREILLVMVSRSGGEKRDRMFHRQFKERVLALPGVKRVSVSSVVPFSPSGTGMSQMVFPPEDPGATAESGRSVRYNTVDPDYFGLLGIPVLRGRGFTERDDRGSPRIMVINETMARSYWPNQDALGQTVRLGSPTNAPVEIVGVVRDTRLNSIQEKPAPYLYLPLAQHDRWQCYFLVESALDASALAGPVRSELGALGRKPTRSDISTIKGFIHDKLSEEQFVAQATGVLALLGLALASVGLYGVLAYAVSRRTREIGIRMALGAQRREVLRMVLRRGLVLALAGLAVGLPVSLAVGYLVRGLLYGVSPLDPYCLGAAGLLLLIVAGVASYVPARRATKVDPIVALRYE